MLYCIPSCEFLSEGRCVSSFDFVPFGEVSSMVTVPDEIIKILNLLKS